MEWKLVPATYQGKLTEAWLARGESHTHKILNIAVDRGDVEPYWYSSTHPLSRSEEEALREDGCPEGASSLEHAKTCAEYRDRGDVYSPWP